MKTRPTVLVVDDSAFMRSRIKRQLTSHGLEVVGEARNGVEGAELYARLRPDLVTMDLTMRGADGLAGTRAILALDSGATVVMFSIVEDVCVVEEALRAGAAAFVHKSRPQELSRRLSDLARRAG